MSSCSFECELWRQQVDALSSGAEMIRSRISSTETRWFKILTSVNTSAFILATAIGLRDGVRCFDA